MSLQTSQNISQRGHHTDFLRVSIRFASCSSWSYMLPLHSPASNPPRQARYAFQHWSKSASGSLGRLLRRMRCPDQDIRDIQPERDKQAEGVHVTVKSHGRDDSEFFETKVLIPADEISN